MAPAIFSYFASNGVSPEPKKAEPIRALPANWYNSQEMFELEKRAIFSKKWMLITHKNRLPNSGDWIKFEVTGYEFVLCKDRKGKINAFHNVCRHRAYALIQGQEGNAKIFACKYHGWSYGLDGKLAKAPKYDELDGFDKSENGLFNIHTREDINGFIWVNLDASENPEPWETEFEGIDQQERLKQYNFEDYVLDHEYQMDGDYNWKILSDNFNECYHCPTSHPDIPALLDIDTLDTQGQLGSIMHKSEQDEAQKRDGLAISSTYFFPNVSVSILPHFIMIQRFLPSSATRSSMHYQIFRNKTSFAVDPTKFHLIANLYAQVVSEDKGLCEQTQRNLNAGIFVNGQLHPRLEKGPLYFQSNVRRVIRQHWELERKLGREVWPARQRGGNKGRGKASDEDEELCEGLCSADRKAVEW